VPFLVAAALQTVQGSRVVTMLIAPSLLMSLIPELGIPPEIVILSMASDTFLISHVNDPFFWIFGELAELKPSEVFKSNTLGSASMSIVSFLLISTMYIFFSYFFSFLIFFLFLFFFFSYFFFSYFFFSYFFSFTESFKLYSSDILPAFPILPP